MSEETMWNLLEDYISQRKEEFPAGCRVRLLRLDGVHGKAPQGETGKVLKVDEAGIVKVLWDCGRTSYVCDADAIERE